MANFENVTPAGSRALDLVADLAADTLVAIDFDGTLAPIVPDPERAYPDPQALAALGRLGALVGQVAIVTGRPVRTCVRLGGFDRVAGLERLIVLGQYGVERWDAASGEFDIPPVPAAVAEAAAELPEVLAAAGHPDTHVENKARAIGVHTRQLPDPQGAYEALAEPVGALAERHGLKVEPGRFVLEIRAASTDKGQALEGLIEQTRPRLVVYGGDDLGDRPAFELVGGLSGRGIEGVRLYAASAEQQSLVEMADVVCQATPGIADWLNAAADAVEARVGSQ